MKTEIEKILKRLIQAKGSLCDYCNYSKNSECQNDDNCTYNNSEGFSPNDTFTTAVKEIKDLIRFEVARQTKKPNYLDVEQYYEDDAEPTVRKNQTVEEPVIKENENER